MVFGKNGSEYGYDLSSEKFRLAFDFLKRDDLSELAVGAIELGEGVVANIQHYETIEWESADFETHDRNFDIQYVIEGEEYCGVCSRSSLAREKKPYDRELDITFYEEPEHSGCMLVKKGEFILLGPEDAHKPRCQVAGPVPVKKVVVKVPV